MTQMILKSRTMTLYTEDFARDVVPPKKAIAQPTPNAKVYADYEEAMMKEAAKMKRRAEPEEDDITHLTNEERQYRVRKTILALMDEPTTAPEIARYLGRNTSTISNRLRSMEQDGLVTSEKPQRDGSNGNCALIWTRTGEPLELQEFKPFNNREVLLEKGRETVERVLDALSWPKTHNDLARELDLAKVTIQRCVKALEGEGKVKVAGLERRSERGKRVMLWVRA